MPVIFYVDSSVRAALGMSLPVLHFGMEGFVGISLYVGAMLAFVLSIFWRPEVGLYFLIPLLPMQTIRYRLHEFPLGGKLIDVMLLGVILGLFVRGRSRDIWNTPLRNMLILFTLFYTASYFFGCFYMDLSLIPSIDDPRFSDFKNYIEMMCIAPIVIAAISDRRKMAVLFLLMALSTVGVSKSFYNNMRDRNTSHFSDSLRESGVLGYAGENGLGAFEAQMTVFFLGLYPVLKRRWQKLGILIVISLSTYCLLFTFSRGGYLGLAAGLLFLGFTKQKKLLLLLLLVAVFWQAVVPTAVRERIGMTYQPSEFKGQGQFDDSAQERLNLWQDALDTIRSRPVTGTGFFTYSYTHAGGGYRDTHNYFLKTLVETGIIGFGLFVWFLGKSLRLGYRLHLAASDPFLQAVGLGFASMMACAFVVNFFGDRWTYIQINGFLWALLAMIVRGHMLVEAEEKAGFVESEQPGSVVPAEEKVAVG